MTTGKKAQNKVESEGQASIYLSVDIIVYWTISTD